MNVELVINEAEFAEALARKFGDAKQPCQLAMAHAFHDMVNENIGQQDGPYRTAWQEELSERHKKYLRRMGAGFARDYATLELTGQLRYSIESEADDDSGWVKSDCPYAKGHQYGLGHLPQRTLFPLEGGEGSAEFSEAAKEHCLEACKEKLIEILQ